MSKLITLLEKVVFLVAGAVIVFLAHVSKSNAEPVEVSILPLEIVVLVQVEPTVSPAG